jgi:small subunit ribosomal protein S16
LKRFGRRHHPTYRLNAVDARRARDGRVIEELGIYDPLNKDTEKQIVLKKERIEYWLGVGAQPSDTVRNILHKNGFAIKAVVRPTKPQKEKEESKPEAPAEEAVASESSAATESSESAGT